MKSNQRRWRPLAAWGLLALLLLISLVLLYLTESSYGAFRAALQQIQFEIRLTDSQEVSPQEVRLQWVATVKMPSVKIPAQLELLDWHLRSSDGNVHLGFYTTRDIQIGLQAGGATEIPLEAVLEGPNTEKLGQLREAAPNEAVPLLFDGKALITFQLPRGERSEKFDVISTFTLAGEEE